MKTLQWLVLPIVSCVPVGASSPCSLADAQRQLAKMEYMAAIAPLLNCYIEDGFDYAGNNIKSVPGQPVENCCALCYATDGYKAFSWTSDDGTYWLKCARGEIVVDPSVKSALFYIGYINSKCLLDSGLDYPASSLRSVADIERRLAKMEYMAAMTPYLNCYLENGFYYVGNDIKSVSGQPPEYCCGICYVTDGCASFSWTEQDGGTCWLKGKRGDIVVNPKAKSALFYIGYENPVCWLKVDVDYAGNDIGRVSAAKAEDCCDKCHNYAGCRAYTWTNQDGGTCWLKSKSGTESYKAGAKSAEAYPTGNYPPAPTCALENNVDFVGNDMGNKPSGSADGCCDICRGTQGCVAFTWTNQNGGTCWLKNRRDASASKPGAVSAQVFVNPPAPTCNLENNVDYVGNDLSNVPNATPGGCCDICKRTIGCRTFTWTDHNGGTCWLKSLKGNTVAKTGAISSQVIENPVDTCTIENDVDYVGDDIGSVQNPVADLCCSVCKAREGCKAFSWSNYQGGTCWLKSGKTTTKSSAGVKSGVV
ncbi:hypothetical protein Poli38472_008048 [Pythium oligandrum]|uniref:Apple domain-containing protein n=1 Tax=Pythium oligandrum TaxID=41045 RepID=A0A8K1CKR4_PYTOL|nr:hypothetical protein Poli38472_008048 [Pythium oligandrum]|eukprot:TMW65406.1 hypothetical protein Poli38472_008048 [Pythium oligandrum]